MLVERHHSYLDRNWIPLATITYRVRCPSRLRMAPLKAFSDELSNQRYPVVGTQARKCTYSNLMRMVWVGTDPSTPGVNQ
ncbi:hypothetical protein TNCV_3813981 [Trichonephila clavipes]|nr:hypothetical protein TNCV_3813981 [Trichonephila clavipes]